MIYFSRSSRSPLIKSRFSRAQLRLVLPLCATIFLGCSAGFIPAANAQPVSAPGGDYRLGLGDSLQITVSNHPDIDSELVVRPDGKITLPGVGELVAAGKTTTSLAAEIERILARTLNNARVRVIVKTTVEQQLSISGAVKAPGQFPFKPGLRVIDIIGRAGGLATKATRIKGRIIRQGKEISFDVDKADSNPASSANIPVFADDVIFLDAQDFTKQLTVTGSVNAPGNYDYTEGLTVGGLLAEAGSVKPEAALKSASILRDNQTIPIDLSEIASGRISPDSPLATFHLKLGDVLTIPENRNRVGVTGEVINPSFYALPENAAEATVLRALSLAGGPKDDSDLSRVMLTRRVNNQQQVITVDAAAIQRGDAPDNTILQPDDILFVPRRDKSVTVGGAVAKPGSYPIDDNETLISLLAKAGDPLQEASLRRISVVRDGKQILLDLSPIFVQGALDPEVAGFRLQGGDVIRVPNTSALITVSGAVAKPGSYNLTDDLSVVSLLAQAGNGTENAALGKAYVNRNGVSIPLDLNVFLSGDTTQPSLTGFRLKAGDTLVIPENKIFYAVLGEVTTPGKFPFPSDATNVSVFRALINAGGPVSKGADLKNAGVLRDVDGQVTLIPVDLNKIIKPKKNDDSNEINNVVLQPGDALYVPTKGKGGFSLSTALSAASLYNIFLR